ncbi:MAG: hypothetical protein WCK05_16725, partial [Planctomycetota bacterium]
MSRHMKKGSRQMRGLWRRAMMGVLLLAASAAQAQDRPKPKQATDATTAAANKPENEVEAPIMPKLPPPAAVKETCLIDGHIAPIPFLPRRRVAIENGAVIPRDARTAILKFDISWGGSFRRDFSHDAAWVFFKVRPLGSSNEWLHVRLAADKVLNPTGYGCA